MQRAKRAIIEVYKTFVLIFSNLCTNLVTLFLNSKFLVDFFPNAAETRSCNPDSGCKARASERRTKRVFALPSAAETRVAFSKDTAKLRQEFAEVKKGVLKQLGLNPTRLSYIYDIRKMTVRTEEINTSVPLHARRGRIILALRWRIANSSNRCHA